ncbi:CdaR family protein [Fonticella tunisiensis]|uniref:YbbR domain-containing protein n=1 Tax=Fonticella tunisiensis TaxID=1096341 RepID=A0A4R7KBP6_9CLOT|nr:CdaR family protein [Fonticella tunisiensis]TDT52087.1 YbbR domain-containing protein [Fonticella tunisiensis]
MANKEKQEIMLIIVSMFLAFILWIYVMGEENPLQTKVIRDIPVKLVNQEAISQLNLALVPEQNITVDITVKGRALSVNNVTPNDFVVEADLAGYPLRKGPNQVPFKIKSKPSTVDIVDNNEYNLINVELDTYLEKTVPVIVNVLGDVKEGYGYLKPECRPTEVLVSGPEKYVNSVVSVVGQVNLDNATTKDLNAVIPVKPQGRDGKTVPYVNVEPKNLNVNVPIKPSKTVPISVKTTGRLPEAKILKSIKPRIDSVTIIGDSNTLDKVKEITTVPFDLSKINSTSTRELFLNIPSGVWVVSDSQDIKSINVDFIVENRIQKNFTVPLNIMNRQDAYNYDVQSTNVNITLSGAESLINSIESKNISASIDLAVLAEGTHQVPVKVVNPDGTDVVDYSPQKIEVTITKK